MTIEFPVSAIIPAPPAAIDNAWPDSGGHTKMTGSPAHAWAYISGDFHAWEGFINRETSSRHPVKEPSKHETDQATRTPMR